MIMAGLRRQKSVDEICRQHQIRQGLYHRRWGRVFISWTEGIKGTVGMKRMSCKYR